MPAHFRCTSTLFKAAFALLASPILASGQSAGTWKASLTLSATGHAVHAGQAYPSSSSLHARWTPHPGAFSHYALELAESRSARRVDTPAHVTDAIVADLKAGTRYSARLVACLDRACSRYFEADDAPSATTPEEYWRINGVGRGFGNADRVVPDGNIGSHAFVYGPWAGTALAGKLQLYYSPFQREEKGVKIAEPTAPRIDTIEDAAQFRGVSGFGLLRLCQPPPPGTPSLPDPSCSGTRSLAKTVALFQAVPLTPEAGGRIRLYFEAQGYDGRTRILHVDSHDGYGGRDFHAGPDTRCNTLADYSAGGGCEPSLDIGVDGDRDRGVPGLESARQFKIAYPTRDSWAWDLSPGTFMWFTTEWRNGRCSSFGFNAAFAVWNGTRWTVPDDGRGCPKLLQGIQAPAPVHLGGAHYKLYFNRHRAPGAPGTPPSNLKPMQLLYADGERSGDVGVVEFDDWEPVEAAREIHYVFEDGTLLTDEEESRLDDYVVFAPTPDPMRLIMYSNMSSASANVAPPFIGSAVLINP